MVHMTCVNHCLRLIQAKTQIDHLVPCISSYPFMSHSHFPNYTSLSSTFCAIPLHTNYVVCVHQCMPWLRAQTMTFLPTQAIIWFLAKTLFLPNQLALFQLDLKQIMRSPIKLDVCTHPWAVPCICPTFPNFCIFNLFEASHKMTKGKDNWLGFLNQNRLVESVVCLHMPLAKVQEPHHQNLIFKIVKNSILHSNLIEVLSKLPIHSPSINRGSCTAILNLKEP